MPLHRRPAPVMPMPEAMRAMLEAYKHRSPTPEELLEVERINMFNIGQLDPLVTKIIHISSHTAVYTYDRDEVDGCWKWSSPKASGCLLFYERNGEPKHGIVIMNRIDIDNYNQLLSPNMEFERLSPYLMFKDGDDIRCMWFYKISDCDTVADILYSLDHEVDTAPDIGVVPFVPDPINPRSTGIISPPTINNAGTMIFEMLSASALRAQVKRRYSSGSIGDGAVESAVALGGAEAVGETGIGGTMGAAGIGGTIGAAGIGKPTHEAGLGRPTREAGIGRHTREAGIRGAIGKAGIGGAIGKAGIGGAIGENGIGRPTREVGIRGAVGKAGIGGAIGENGIGRPTREVGIRGAVGKAGIGGAIGKAGIGGAIGESGIGRPTREVGIRGAIGKAGIGGAIGEAGIGRPTREVGIRGAIGKTGIGGAIGEARIGRPTREVGIRGAIGKTGIGGAIGEPRIGRPTREVGIRGAIGKTGIGGAVGEAGIVRPTREVGIRGAIDKAGIGGAIGEAGIGRPTREVGIRGGIGEAGIGAIGEARVGGATGGAAGLSHVPGNNNSPLPEIKTDAQLHLMGLFQNMTKSVTNTPDPDVPSANGRRKKGKSSKAKLMGPW